MTTDEPTYTFVKGQGWIPRIEDYIECLDSTKTRRVRIINKRPESGEWYIHGLVGWTLEDYAVHASQFSWARAMPWTEYSGRPDERIMTVVVVPL